MDLRRDSSKGRTQRAGDAGRLGVSPSGRVKQHEIGTLARPPPSEIPGTRLSRGCGRDAGIFNLDRHRVTNAGRRDSGIPSPHPPIASKPMGKPFSRANRRSTCAAPPTAPSVPTTRERLPAPGGGRRGLRRDGRQWRQLGADLHSSAALAPRPRPRARPLGDGRHPLGAAHRLPQRPRPRRARSSQTSGSRSAPAPDTRPCSATRSATRSPPRSCAGTAAAGSSASCAACTTPPSARTPRRSSPTSTTRAPSTSSCPFIDLVCFNVFLESGPQFESYLARLQNIAGDRPAAGHRGRARLPAQLRGAHRRRRSTGRSARPSPADAPGMFVFSWTDEWHRGGFDIEDWAFGLVDRDREPKQALATVGKAFSETPFRADPAWPRISVVVCAYNSEDTLRSCFDGLRELRLPRLRGDRRQRRLDRPHGRDHRGVRVPADQHREPGSRERAQRGPARGDRRDRRLHRRRRAPRPALARPPGDRVS